MKIILVLKLATKEFEGSVLWIKTTIKGVAEAGLWWKSTLYALEQDSTATHLLKLVHSMELLGSDRVAVVSLCFLSSLLGFECLSWHGGVLSSEPSTIMAASGMLTSLSAAERGWLVVQHNMERRLSCCAGERLQDQRTAPSSVSNVSLIVESDSWWPLTEVNVCQRAEPALQLLINSQ